jgi:hypothetical protein
VTSNAAPVSAHANEGNILNQIKNFDIEEHNKI